MVALVLMAVLLFPFHQGGQDGVQQDFMVESFVNNESPYAGEQILYTFRYYSYLSSADVRDVLPEFEGFWLTDIYGLANSSRIEAINGRQYVVQEVYADITPIQPGELIISPAVLEVPPTVFRDALRLETDPIRITVRPLPDGAPNGFNGAVGQFNASFSLDETTITLGQPLTLTMTVDGTGSLERLTAPRLPVVEGWRIYTNPSRYEVSEVGSLRFGQKVFEWLLVPEQTGTQVFPSIDFVFFDPQRDVYRTLTSDPLMIQVFPGEDNLNQLPSFTDVNGEQIVQPLKPVNLSSFSPQLPDGFWLLWFVPPALVVLVRVGLWGRSRLTVRQLHQRKITALSRLKSRIQHFNGHDDLERVVYAYLADKLGCTEPVVRSLDLVSLLHAHRIDSQSIEQFEAVLASVRHQRYLPDTVDGDVQALIQRILSVLGEVDRQWL